jgi:hypothetical protein
VKERRVEVVSKSLPQFLALVSRQDVLSPKMNHFISIPCFVSREIRHGQNKRQKSKLNGTLKHLLNVHILEPLSQISPLNVAQTQNLVSIRFFPIHLEFHAFLHHESTLNKPFAVT